MNLDCCRLMVLLAMPTAVLLSQCTGVADCGWPSSLRMRQKIFPSLQLRKRAPSSASAADETTNLSIAHKVKNAPFNLIGSPSIGIHPRKK